MGLSRGSGDEAMLEVPSRCADIVVSFAGAFLPSQLLNVEMGNPIRVVLCSIMQENCTPRRTNLDRG